MTTPDEAKNIIDLAEILTYANSGDSMRYTLIRNFFFHFKIVKQFKTRTAAKNWCKAVVGNNGRVWILYDNHKHPGLTNLWHWKQGKFNPLSTYQNKESKKS